MKPRLILCLLLLLSSRAIAQPLLPDLVGVTQKGMNLLSWTSQYQRLKSIAVQRSNDSFFNYATIGYVKDLQKGPQAFIDGHPLPGTNWYRLQIAFGSDLVWTSNRIKLFVDSAQLMAEQVIAPNDSLQKLVANIRYTGTPTDSLHTPEIKTRPVLSLSLPASGNTDAYTYIKSQYVFTNPFTGHVNVEIKDAKTERYSLIFYDEKKQRTLDIPRIPEPIVIIDKRNFPHKGIYRFDLIRNKKKLESGYITIY